MKQISVADLHKKMKENDVQVIDVRSVSEFKNQYIQGVLNIPTETIMNHRYLFDGKETCLVCHSGTRSASVYKQLEQEGIENISTVIGGVKEWVAQQLPVQGQKKTVMPIMRQVMVAAGSLILAGVGLHFFVVPQGVFLSAGVGLGLCYAGLSGNCYLMKALEKMPWNKA